MAYSAMAVANAFIKRAKEKQLRDLSPMKLQKLLFFAQSWYLARNDEPLIDDFFCRWQYGPVVQANSCQLPGHTIRNDEGGTRGSTISGGCRGSNIHFVGRGCATVPRR